MEPVVLLERLHEAPIEEKPVPIPPPTRRVRRKKNKRLLFDRRKLYYSKAARLEAVPFEGWPAPNHESNVEECNNNAEKILFQVPDEDGLLHFHGFGTQEQTISSSQHTLSMIENEDIIRWRTRVISISPDNRDEFKFTIVPIVPRKVRVLALCDGLATGLYCLKKLGFDVDTYFSCEIDVDALAVQRSRFPGQVIALGCMEAASQPQFLDALGRIDLILGSPPCSDFSLLNASRREWSHPDSTAFLSLTFIRIKNYLEKKMTSNGYPFFWLCEQTAHLSRPAKVRLSREMGCQPYKICASSFVPMYRSRLFFGNIPNLGKLASGLQNVQCEATLLGHYLDPFRVATVKFANTLTTNAGTMGYPVLEGGVPSRLNIREAEALMGFCRNFTACSNLSVQRRLNLMGKAWNTFVISAILAPLKDFFVNV